MTRTADRWERRAAQGSGTLCLRAGGGGGRGAEGLGVSGCRGGGSPGASVLYGLTAGAPGARNDDVPACPRGRDGEDRGHQGCWARGSLPLISTTGDPARESPRVPASLLVTTEPPKAAEIWGSVWELGRPQHTPPLPPAQQGTPPHVMGWTVEKGGFCATSEPLPGASLSSLAGDSGRKRATATFPTEA